MLNEDVRKCWDKMRDGDATSFKILYDYYIDDIVRYGQKITSRTTLIQEAIQNQFIYIWDHRADLTTPRHVKSYLLISFKHSLLREIKRDSRLIKLDLVDIRADIESKSSDIDADDEYYNKIGRLIDMLSDREKEIVHLRYYQGIKNNEISEIMNISYQSVGNLLNRAIKKLRKGLV